MKSILFTSLIAAAAALPQYGAAPSFNSMDITSTDALNSFPTVDASSVAGVSYAGSAGSTGTGKTACTKKGKKHQKTSTGVTAFPTMAAGSTDGVTFSGAAGSTGTGKTACTKKGKKHSKTASAVASPTATGTDAGFSNDTSASPSDTASASVPISTLAPANETNSTSAGTNSTSSAGSSNSSNSSSTDNGDFLRGINVGNWLILEKWMDDGSVFTGSFSGASDQWSFDSIDGAEEALQKHWSSWFTEDDVAKIASHGFNALRIPIGFWAFDNSGTPYKQGAAYWMDQAISWAAKHNMKVLVDMHGSPGSQNGEDHSGHAGAIQWQQGDNLDHSTKILVQMAKKYGAANYSSVVWGIETVNEPTANSPNNFGKSQSWSQDAYEQMYDVLENKNIRIVTHDSFMGPQKFVDIAQGLAKKLPVAIKAQGSSSSSSSQGTTYGVDQHDYQLYTDSDNSLDQKTHIKNACGWADNLKQAKAAMPTIVGEWSSLTNICASDDGNTWASKGGGGGSCTSDDPSKWSKALVEQVRRYVEAQLDVYEQNTDGYFLWSYKGPGGWGLDDPVAAGAFPSNVVSDRKYKGQCGGN